FTKALALENARKGITVNCICPGYIDTDMVADMPPKVLEGIIAQIPLGRLGKAEEVASLVAYLASDQAAFVTGAVRSMNGAQYSSGYAPESRVSLRHLSPGGDGRKAVAGGMSAPRNQNGQKRRLRSDGSGFGSGGPGSSGARSRRGIGKSSAPDE